MNVILSLIDRFNQKETPSVTICSSGNKKIVWKGKDIQEIISDTFGGKSVSSVIWDPSHAKLVVKDRSWFVQDRIYENIQGEWVVSRTFSIFKSKVLGDKLPTFISTLGAMQGGMTEPLLKTSNYEKFAKENPFADCLKDAGFVWESQHLVHQLLEFKEHKELGKLLFQSAKKIYKSNFSNDELTELLEARFMACPEHHGALHKKFDALIIQLERSNLVGDEVAFAATVVFAILNMLISDARENL